MMPHPAAPLGPGDAPLAVRVGLAPVRLQVSSDPRGGSDPQAGSQGSS